MKHKIKIISCLLAIALATSPMIACNKAPTVYDINIPSDSDAIRPPSSDGTDSVAPPNTEEPPSDTPMPDPVEPDDTRPTVPNEPSAPPEVDMPDDVRPPEPEAPTTHEVRYISVLVNGLNVRSGAGTSYPSLGTVEKGVLLKLTETRNGWHKTVYKNSVAYVSASPTYSSVISMEFDEVNDAVERVIDNGLPLLGTKYVYGATRLHNGKGVLLSGFSTSAFDCSSLMQYMFYKGAQVNLDVTSRTQCVQGREIAKSQIKRGDLLFFTNATRKDYSGIERVGHVALYLGNNYILHTASDYAKIEQITPLRHSYYITARRIIE